MTDTAPAPALEVVDRGEAAAAVAVLAPLFEGAPTFLGRLLEERPFGSWDALFERARAVAHDMPEPDQVELVNAHPRLGASAATVSALSFREQGYDREPPPASPDAGELARLNAAYEAAFGFRYCVFVAGRPLATLVPELRSALSRERGAELRRAIDAVVDIAVARHRALAGTNAETASR